MIIIRGVYLFGYTGFSFFIFLFFAEKNPSPELINHERIHFYQQLELLFVIHWILYLGSYTYNYLSLVFTTNLTHRQRHWKAYFNNVFEKEAYENDKDLSYLSTRQTYAWTRYLS
jgi:hypothetical protein